VGIWRDPGAYHIDVVIVRTFSSLATTWRGFLESFVPVNATRLSPLARQIIDIIAVLRSSPAGRHNVYVVDPARVWSPAWSLFDIAVVLLVIESRISICRVSVVPRLLLISTGIQGRFKRCVKGLFVLEEVTWQVRHCRKTTVVRCGRAG